VRNLEKITLKGRILRVLLNTARKNPCESWTRFVKTNNKYLRFYKKVHQISRRKPNVCRNFGRWRPPEERSHTSIRYVIFLVNKLKIFLA
jgi:hypothetical protein